MKRCALDIAVLLVVLNVVVVWGGASGKQTTSEPADCAIVLGARVYSDGTPSPVLRDRLDEALLVWREGKVRRILVTGDHGTLSYDEPTAMRTYLEAHDVPREAIILDHAGFDTFSSMWRATHVFGAKRVVVVTQKFHLARSVWIARELGMQAEGRASDHRAYRGIVWLELRKMGSRAKAFLDVAFGRKPRYTTG